MLPRRPARAPRARRDPLDHHDEAHQQKDAAYGSETPTVCRTERMRVAVERNEPVEQVERVAQACVSGSPK